MLYVVDSLFLVHKMRRYLKHELDFKSNVFFLPQSSTSPGIIILIKSSYCART